jgi:hypothetical protein
MVDDGFLIGFEDSSGNFVEVGRFNNLADDVTQPLEIKHQNSGERVTLDSSGLKTQKMDDDRLYAGAFSGTDPDTRLSNARNEAKTGDVIFLEAEVYTQDQTFTQRVSLIGTTIEKGTRIDGGATWTIDGFGTTIKGLRLDGTIQQNTNGIISEMQMTTGDIIIAGDNSIVHSVRGGIITLQSGTSNNIIDTCTGVTVNDNGTNTVGDIA